MKRRWIAASVAALFSIGAMPVPTGKRSEFTRPPFTGGYEPRGTDERGLWMQMDEVERTFRDSPSVVRDAVLNDYVRSILCKTVGFDRCSATRIYIVRDARFNASMAPNGMMLVHTGLLARVHSEAELAAVLAHEFAHFELRHSLSGFRKFRSTTDLLAWVSLAGAATNTSVNATENALISGMFSFNREQEKAADLLSAAYVRSSPYPLSFSTIWRRLIEEDDAIRNERKLDTSKNPRV